MATRQTLVFLLISVYAIGGSEGFFGWSDESDCLAACTTEGYVCRLISLPWPWNTDRWFCKIADCGSPSQVANGSVTLCDGTKFEDLAFYVCEEGFGLSGGPTPRTCQGDETWSGTDPACLIVCDSLPAPANGDVAFSGYLEGDTATFTCDTGYVISAGTSTRTCQSDGTWDGSAVTCGPINCGALSDPADGEVDTSDGTTYEEEAVYSCDPGYELVGCEFRTCMSDGNWSPEEPTCELIVLCPTLADPANGDVMITPASRVIGSTAEFDCNGGYQVIGDNPLYCTPDGTWSNSAPVCVADCGALTPPANGYLVSEEGQLDGDTVVFACLEGYVESGDASRTCQTSSVWSGTPLTCNPIDCGSLSAPANGTVDTSGGTTFENTAIFSCSSDDLWLNGCEFLVCTSNGTWVPSEPTCDDVDCPALSAPAGGSVYHYDGRRIGNFAEYQCDWYLVRDGNSKRYCLIDGTWSGSEPTCRVDCYPPLSAPTHGDLTGSGNFEGDSITVSCDRGYVVSGSATRTCQPDGTWSGSAFSCIEITCSPTSDPSGGWVNTADWSFEGYLEYGCNTGRTLNGPNRRTCLSTGLWSGVMPTCEPIDCGPPNAPCNGTVSFTATTYNNQATHSCDTGFTLEGTATQTCTPNGWDPQPRPCCEITTCDELTNAPLHGSIDNSDGHYYNDVVTYTCDTCWVLQSGSASRTCQADGTWSGTAPICGTGVYNLTGDLFYFFNCPKPWGEALSVCHAFEPTPAELVKIENANVSAFIEELLDAGGIGVPGDQWWTGATDAANEGTWVWSDSGTPSPVGDIDWASGEPMTDTTENCMALEQTSAYKWQPYPCTTALPFICWIEG